VGEKWRMSENEERVNKIRKQNGKILFASWHSAATLTEVLFLILPQF
jgi:lysophospholipid acyltransferase (LPLAT)-like uncharacterized protein